MNTPDDVAGVYHRTLPANRLYWALLPAASAPGGAERASGSPDEAALNALEGVLPVPIDSVHAVTAVGSDGTLVICACPHEILEAVQPDTLRLLPAAIPPGVPHLEPGSLNLLTGIYEPGPLRRARTKVAATLAAALVLTTALLSAALVQRERAYSRAADAFTTMRNEALRAAFPEQPPPAAAMLLPSALETARRSQRMQAPPPADAARALAAFLSAWPSLPGADPAEVEVLSITGNTLNLTCRVPDHTAAAELVSRLVPPPGYAMAPVRTSAHHQGVRLIVQARRMGSP